jgi:hypothetical protein
MWRHNQVLSLSWYILQSTNKPWECPFKGEPKFPVSRRLTAMESLLGCQDDNHSRSPGSYRSLAKNGYTFHCVVFSSRLTILCPCGILAAPEWTERGTGQVANPKVSSELKIRESFFYSLCLFTTFPWEEVSSVLLLSLSILPALRRKAKRGGRLSWLGAHSGRLTELEWRETTIERREGQDGPAGFF